jgi:predicted branched-subunit amino acid permease
MVQQPFSFRALLSFMLTDEAYAVTISRIYQSGYHASHQLGASLAMYITWCLSTIAGVLVGGYISDPLAWGLDFAMPATFMVLLFPRLVDRTGLIVCIVAGIVAVLGALYLPGKWYMIIACLVATLVGGMVEGEKQHA